MSFRLLKATMRFIAPMAPVVTNDIGCFSMTAAASPAEPAVQWAGKGPLGPGWWKHRMDGHRTCTFSRDQMDSMRPSISPLPGLCIQEVPFQGTRNLVGELLMLSG